MNEQYWRSSLNLTEEETEKFCTHDDWVHGVHRHADGKYWWYDETQTDEFGPFGTFEAAQLSLVGYAKTL